MGLGIVHSICSWRQYSNSYVRIPCANHLLEIFEVVTVTKNCGDSYQILTWYVVFDVCVGWRMILVSYMQTLNKMTMSWSRHKSIQDASSPVQFTRAEVKKNLSVELWNRSNVP